MEVKKRPVIYLHIGMNKTGTTAIQSFLYDNKKKLAGNGVLYPDTGLIGSTHYSISASLGFCHANVASGWVQDISELKRSLLKEAQGFKSVIISSEDFLLNKPIEPIKDFFKGYELKIVVYLRRHDHWWVSAYGQAVKMKALPPWGKGPQAFIRFNQNKNKQYGNYRYLLDRWAKVFGKQNIIVRPYESQQNQPNLMSDFLGCIDQSLVAVELIGEQKRNNEALSRKAIQYLDIFQRVKADEATRVKLLASAAVMGGGSCADLVMMINPVFRKKLLEEKRLDYEYIAKEYMGRENGKLFFEPLPVLNPEWKPPKWPTQEEVAENVISILS